MISVLRSKVEAKKLFKDSVGFPLESLSKYVYVRRPHSSKRNQMGLKFFPIVSKFVWNAFGMLSEL